jgi:hypothetical protein
VKSGTQYPHEIFDPNYLDTCRFGLPARSMITEWIA